MFKLKLNSKGRLYRYYKHNIQEGCYKKAKEKADSEGRDKLRPGEVPGTHVRADWLEKAVFETLIKTIGNKEALTKSIREAQGISDEKGTEIEKELAKLTKELGKVTKEQEKWLKVIKESEHIQNLKGIDKEVGKLSVKEQKLREKIEILEEQFKNLPDKKEIEKRGKNIKRDLEAMKESMIEQIEHSLIQSKKGLPAKELAEWIVGQPYRARNLIRALMPSKDYGVYLRHDGRFAIKTILPNEIISSLVKKRLYL